MDELLRDWFSEIRALAGELPSHVPPEDIEVTLKARGGWFGARCLRFAASGATPGEAMTHLRAQMRAALGRTESSKGTP